MEITGIGLAGSCSAARVLSSWSRLMPFASSFIPSVSTSTVFTRAGSKLGAHRPDGVQHGVVQPGAAVRDRLQTVEGAGQLGGAGAALTVRAQ